MTSTPPPPTGEPVSPLGYDPAEGLALLHQSQETVLVDQQLDFGPWWYVPVLGFLYPALFTWIWGELGGLGAIIGVTAISVAALTLVHDRRRRGARVSWAIPSKRNGRGMAIMFAMNFVTTFGWLQTSFYADDLPVRRYLLVMLVGWLVTMAVIAVARSALLREREKVLGS